MLRLFLFFWSILLGEHTSTLQPLVEEHCGRAWLGVAMERMGSGGAQHMTVAEKHANRSITLYQATITSLEEKLKILQIERDNLADDLVGKELELAAATKEPDDDEEDQQYAATPAHNAETVRRRARGRAKVKEVLSGCTALAGRDSVKRAVCAASHFSLCWFPAVCWFQTVSLYVRFSVLLRTATRLALHLTILALGANPHLAPSRFALHCSLERCGLRASTLLSLSPHSLSPRAAIQPTVTPLSRHSAFWTLSSQWLSPAVSQSSYLSALKFRSHVQYMSCAPHPHSVQYMSCTPHPC